ncbi:hypothetical protein Tco_1152311 [Tanacetum coccineum]
MRRLPFGLIPRTLPGVLKMLETGQRARSYAGRDPGHLLSSEIDGELHHSREEMLRLQGFYNDDQIMAVVRRGKQLGHIPGVGRVLAGRGRDVLVSPEPRYAHTADVDELKRINKQLKKQMDMIMKYDGGSGSRSGGVGDDKPGDDEDTGEEEDEDS